jgi:hypothetical protein
MGHSCRAPRRMQPSAGKSLCGFRSSMESVTTMLFGLMILGGAAVAVAAWYKILLPITRLIELSEDLNGIECDGEDLIASRAQCTQSRYARQNICH